ncbi:putative mitochondrial protein AtMg00310 [Castanea sativa]|uniref:putative mitochondrial protein AtMg00310 n=1 Tax=Castanea sativa TaxID=21020 RepID=UPI003F6514C8
MVWKKLQGWKEKLLSQAGRETLIKSVIQAIPTYTMSCFKLPKGLIKDLEVLIRKFWWGYNGDNRKVHWVKWEKLCEAKEEGGLGFKEIEKFNEALLAKQVWRMINNPKSLCHRVFKARFFPECSILEAKDSSVGSYAWKSICSARDVIRKGMVWRIGNGESVRIKMDKWPPAHSNRPILDPSHQLAPDAKVSELIDYNSAAWKSDLVHQLFLP